jgi:hypothetical protein
MNTKIPDTERESVVVPSVAQGVATIVVGTRVVGDGCTETTTTANLCVGDSVRAATRFAILCDPSTLDDFPLEVGFSTPESVRHARELARRFSFLVAPEAP